MESQRVALADLQGRSELLDQQHRETIRSLHHELEVEGRKKQQVLELHAEAMRRREVAQNAQRIAEDRLSLRTWIGSPILALAAGGAGWALERFVLG